MERMIRQFGAFIVLIAVTYAPSFIAYPYMTPHNFNWYHSLTKPFFMPPDWVFSVVWTVLYFFMACAAWMIWKKKGFFCKQLSWYYAQLVVNAVYIPAFFGLHLMYGSALILVLLLWLVIKTLRFFAQVDHYAALLLTPYVAWLCFASLLWATTAYLN